MPLELPDRSPKNSRRFPAQRPRPPEYDSAAQDWRVSCLCAAFWPSARPGSISRSRTFSGSRKSNFSASLCCASARAAAGWRRRRRHQASPAGMHSMNLGLREAADLAASSQSILRDHADPDVLQDYDRLHRPNGSDCWDSSAGPAARRPLGLGEPATSQPPRQPSRFGRRPEPSPGEVVEHPSLATSG